MHYKTNNFSKLVSLEMLNYLAKAWLIAMLLISPYQAEIMKHVGSWSSNLSRVVQLLDELTIIVFFPLAMRVIYKERNRFHLFLLIALPLCLFSFEVLLSGTINSNPLLTTTYGTFYYIKYFLLIFIYAAYFSTLSEFKNIFRYLLVLAIIAGIVTFLEEVIALLFRHILVNDSYVKTISTINSIVTSISHDDILHNFDNWRLGIYRVSSIMSHYNLLGFYSLLILTLYLFTAKRIKPFYLISLISGIYFSVSRVALTGLIILCTLQAVKGRKWMILLVIIPLCVVIYSFSHSSDFNLKDVQMMPTLSTSDSQKIGYNITYRQYAKNIAMDIWKDHPFFGVGPGMFGGVVARRSNSPFYEEYNFPFNLLVHFSDLDQFWPQALAETGIIGTIVFSNVYICLLLAIMMYKKMVLTVELKNYLAGLSLLTVFVFINTFASSLNIISILYPYCALTGMGFGIAVNELS